MTHNAPRHPQAIVSPTDAVAATAIFHRLGVPRRLMVVLEGESLVNDAMALILYTTALALATGAGRPFSARELVRCIEAALTAAGSMA